VLSKVKTQDVRKKKRERTRGDSAVNILEAQQKEEGRIWTAPLDEKFVSYEPWDTPRGG